MSVVVILGAHTPAGRALSEILSEREVEAEVIAATTTEYIEDGLVLLDAGVLQRGELFVITTGDSFTVKIAEGLVAQGKLVIDAEGKVALPLRCPSTDSDPTLKSSLRIPLGLVEPMAACVRALAPLEPRALVGATYESAAAAGKAGIEELSDQTRRVFTMDAKDPEVFAASLAFDAIPIVEEEGGASFEADLRDCIGGAGELALSVRRVRVPSFSAEAAMIHLHMASPAPEEEVRTLLESAPGLRRTDGLAPSLDAVGRDDALLGHLRVNGEWVSMWLAVDRLRRGGPSQAALWIERWASDKKSDTAS